jgi:hypothetical protein
MARLVRYKRAEGEALARFEESCRVRNAAGDLEQSVFVTDRPSADR